MDSSPLTQSTALPRDGWLLLPATRAELSDLQRRDAFRLPLGSHGCQCATTRLQKTADGWRCARCGTDAILIA
jgi:hypothetical protein